MTSQILSLDRTDFKILEILQNDGRISNIKLAEMVNLSATAAFVEILLDKTTPNVLEEFSYAVVQYPEIVECHMISGGFDFVVKIRCASMEEFRKISGQVLWQLPGVKETRSYPVMEVIKESSKIKLKSPPKPKP